MDVYAALRWFFTKASTIEGEPMVRGSGMRGKGSIVFRHNDSIGLVVAGVQDEGTGSLSSGSRLFDLQGRPVATPQAGGLYIRDGRKVRVR